MNSNKSPQIQSSNSYRSNKNSNMKNKQIHKKQNTSSSKGLVNGRSSKNINWNSKSEDQSYFTAQSHNQNSLSMFQEVADTPIRVDELEASGNHTFSNQNVQFRNKKKLLQEFEQIKDEIISQNQNHISNIKFDNFISFSPNMEDNDQINIKTQNNKTLNSETINFLRLPQQKSLQKRQSMPENIQQQYQSSNQQKYKQNKNNNNLNSNISNNKGNSSNEKSTHRNSIHSNDGSKRRGKDQMLQIQKLHAHENMDDDISNNQNSDFQPIRQLNKNLNYRQPSKFNEINLRSQINYHDMKKNQQFNNLHKLNLNPDFNVNLKNQNQISSQQIISDSLRQFQHEFQKFKTEIEGIQLKDENEDEPQKINEQTKAKWSRNDKVVNRISPDFTVQNVQTFQDTKHLNHNSMSGFLSNQNHLVSTSTFGNVNEVYKQNGLDTSNSNFRNNFVIEEKQSLDSDQDFQEPPFDTNNLNSKQLSLGNYLKSIYSGNNGTLMQTLNSNYEPELIEREIKSNKKRKDDKLKEQVLEQYKKELNKIKENKRARYHSSSYNQQPEERREHFPLNQNRQHQHKRFNSTDGIYLNDKQSIRQRNQSQKSPIKQKCNHKIQKQESLDSQQCSRKISQQMQNNQVNLSEISSFQKSNEEIFFELVERVCYLEKKLKQNKLIQKQQVPPQLPSKPSSFKEIALYLQDLIQFYMNADFQNQNNKKQILNTNQQDKCQYCAKDEESFYKNQILEQQTPYDLDRNHRHIHLLQNQIQCQNCVNFEKNVQKQQILIKNLKGNIDDLKKDGDEKDYHLKKLNLSNLDLQTKINAANKQIFQLSSNINNVGSNHEVLLKKYADQQSDIQQLILENNALKLKKENLIQQIYTLKNEFSKQQEVLKSENLSLQNKNQDQNQIIFDLQNQIQLKQQEYLKQLQVKEECLEKIKHQNSQLLLKLEEFEKQMSQKLRNVHEEIRSKLQMEVKAQENITIDQKNQEIKLLQLELRKMHHKINDDEQHMKMNANIYDSNLQREKKQLDQMYQEKIQYIEMELKGTKLLEERTVSQLNAERDVRNKLQQEVNNLQDLIKQQSNENNFLENENKFYKAKIQKMQNQFETQIEFKKQTGRRGQSADFTQKYNYYESELDKTLKVSMDDSKCFKNRKNIIDKFQDLREQIQYDFDGLKANQDIKMNDNYIKEAECIYQDYNQQILAQAMMIEKISKQQLRKASCICMQQNYGEAQYSLEQDEKINCYFQNDKKSNSHSKKNKIQKQSIDKLNKQKQSLPSLRQMWRQAQKDMKSQISSASSTHQIKKGNVVSPKSQRSKSKKSQLDEQELKIEVLKAAQSEQINSLNQKLQYQESKNKDYEAEIQKLREKLISLEDKNETSNLNTQKQLEDEILQKRNEIQDRQQQESILKEQIFEQQQQMTKLQISEQNLSKLNEELRQMIKEEREITKDEFEAIQKQINFQRSKFRAVLFLIINRIHILAQSLKIYLPVQVNKKQQSEQDHSDEKEQIENMLDTLIQTVKMNNQTFQNMNQIKKRISQSRENINRNNQETESCQKVLDDSQYQSNLLTHNINNKSSQILIDQKTHRSNLHHQSSQAYSKNQKDSVNCIGQINCEKSYSDIQIKKTDSYKMLQKSYDQRKKGAEKSFQQDLVQNFLLMENNQNSKVYETLQNNINGIQFNKDFNLKQYKVNNYQEYKKNIQSSQDQKKNTKTINNQTKYSQHQQKESLSKSFETPNYSRIAKKNIQNNNQLIESNAECSTLIEDESKISTVLNSCIIKKKQSHHPQKSSRYFEVLSQSLDQELQSNQSQNRQQNKRNEFDHNDKENDDQKQLNLMGKPYKSEQIIQYSCHNSQKSLHTARQTEGEKSQLLQRVCVDFNKKLKMLRDKLQSTDNSEQRSIEYNQDFSYAQYLNK